MIPARAGSGLARVALAGAAWLALCVGASSALAQAERVVVSAGPASSAVVFYRDRPVSTTELMASVRGGRVDPGLGLGLVVERRVIDIPAGEAVIRLEGLADGVIAETAIIEGLPAEVRERNLDYDLLTPGSLVARSVGMPVTVARTNRETGAETLHRAILRAAPQGVVVEVDGQIEALNCSGLTERIIFDAVPPGLAERPTLTLRTQARRAQRAEITIAYLAGGLMWSADYVARINPDGETLSLTGWLTLANVGTTAFPSAPVQAVAGRFSRDDGTRPVQPTRTWVQPSCWPQDTTTRNAFGAAPPPPPPPPAPIAMPTARAEAALVDEIVVTGSRIGGALAEQSDLGDYKLYTLPEPTTVQPRQTKQVRFLEQPAVEFDRLYRHRFNEFSLTPDVRQPVELLVRTRNEADRGLGLALPGGSATIMETVGGRALLAGQAEIEDVPIGLPVEFSLGAASSVGVHGRMVSDKQEGDHRVIEVELMLGNDRDEAVTVEMISQAQVWPGFRILETSAPTEVADSGLTVFRIEVSARGMKALRYRFQVED